MRNRYLLAAALLAVPAVASAEDRDYCPTRPGLGTTPCTISPGRVSVETALGDWTREDDADTRTDTVLIGDTLVRIGVSDAIEAQVGWTPYGHVHERDKASGAIDRSGGVGDVLLGFKANLHNPDGKGFSVALQPFVTLPVGGKAIGAGDWGAGMVVPMAYDLSDALSLQSTAEIDAAVDEDGNGRHLAYSETLGLGLKLSEAVTTTLELQALRDQDPSGHATQTFASLSVGWMANDDLQLDAGAVAGLNHNSASAEIYAGVSRRF